MKVELAHITETKKRIEVVIPAEDVAEKFAAVLKDINRRVKIKGFRPGKVPKAILFSLYRDAIEREVIEQLVKESYPGAVRETGIMPVSEPSFEIDALEEGREFRYRAVVDVIPDYDVTGYMGLELPDIRREIKEEEVLSRLEDLRIRYAKVRNVEGERTVREGDIVVIDTEGYMDGKEMKDGKISGRWIDVGMKEHVPGFEEALVGMRIGETKEITIRYPEDWHQEELRGKEAVFRVTVKEIKERLLPEIDDEFARDVGDFENLEELKEKIKRDLEKEEDIRIRNILEDEIINMLSEKNPVQIPERLIEEETERLISEFKERMRLQRVELHDISEEQKEEFRKQAKKGIQKHLYFKKIAEKEGIQVLDNEVEEKLKEIASSLNQPVERIKALYGQGGRMQGLKERLLYNKVFDFIYKNAKLKQKDENGK